MEGLRAYAAGIVYLLHLVGVFFHERLGIDFNHVSVIELAETNLSFVPFYWLFSSHYGVDIFFLLSGYLIAGLVCKESFNYPKFLLHRFLRIYPVLVISTLAFVAFDVFVDDEIFWLGGIIGNLLLLNGIPGGHFPSINFVTWSLFFEFAFYFSFPIIWKVCRGQLRPFLLVSLALIVALAFIAPSYIRFLMFSAGVVLKVAPESSLFRVRRYVSDWTVIALYLLCTTVFVFTRNWLIFIPLYIVPAMLLVDKAISSNGMLAKVLSTKPMRYFGNISFSFYLFHPLAIAISRKIIVDVQSDAVHFGLLLSLSLVFSLLFSIVCFTCVERQYFKGKQRIDDALHWLGRFGKL